MLNGSFHVSIEKSLLIREIRRLGLRAVLVVPDDVTEDEMIARIEADPRAHFVMTPECDRQNDDGTCAGHPAGESKRASEGRAGRQRSSVTKRIDYYACKARARKSACGELDEALAALASAEQRSAAAAKKLVDVERQATEELAAKLAEIERERQAAMEAAERVAAERMHAARSEHGTAAALVAKAHAAVEQARDRLLRLVPSDDELRAGVADGEGASGGADEVDGEGASPLSSPGIEQASTVEEATA